MNILAMLSLQLAISVPCCLLIIFYWTIPESPRWLVSKNRIKVSSSSSFLFCEIFRNSSLSQICGELNHFGKIRRLLKSWSRQQQQMETRFLEMTRCPIDWLMWTTISFLHIIIVFPDDRGSKEFVRSRGHGCSNINRGQTQRGLLRSYGQQWLWDWKCWGVHCWQLQKGLPILSKVIPRTKNLGGKVFFAQTQHSLLIT